VTQRWNTEPVDSPQWEPDTAPTSIPDPATILSVTSSVMTIWLFVRGLFGKRGRHASRD
jgi:hypothetical protein